MLLIAIALSSLQAAPKPPSIKQCKSKWVLTPTQVTNFGGFALEAGSGSVLMNNLAGRLTTGQISLSNSIPPTTFTVGVDNTKHAICATYGFSFDWATPPAALAGPGTAISFSNVRVTIPAYGLTNVTLPRTIAPNPANTIPFTMTFSGDIGVNFPQAAGAYISPNFIVELTQDGTAKTAAGTASATSFTPLSIVETLAMDFGTVAGGQTAGSIVLDTSGNRSATGDAQILLAGPASAASFQVTGQSNQVYSLVFGNGTLANAGGQQLSITGFTTNSLGSVPASGVETFQAGATLNLAPGQPAGLYSTSNPGASPYTITINYN